MDDLGRAIAQIRSEAAGESDHAELWAELDRDNEVRREYRARGLEPPSFRKEKNALTYTPGPVLASPPAPTLWETLAARASAAADATRRAFEVLVGWALVLGFLAWIGSYAYDWKYGPLSTSRYESFDVGVWVTPPAGDVVYLGITRGATACGQEAWAYALAKAYGPDRWSYACCTHRNGSTCYEKIR